MSTRRLPSDSRLPRWEGEDADFQYFSTPSWTRAGLRHDLYIDKRTGEFLCQCEDAVCRKKRPDFLRILKGEPEDCCKHVRAWIIAYKHLLEISIK